MSVVKSNPVKRPLNSPSKQSQVLERDPLKPRSLESSDHVSV